jgi:hypothetical protein
LRLDPEPIWQKNEDTYNEIAKGYKPDEITIFAQLLAEVVNELDANPEQDFLGSIFMQLDLGNDATGQYFTPYNVSSMISQASFDKAHIQRIIEEKGYITVDDPCIGAGGMLIGFFNAVRDAGFNPQTQALFSGTVVDFDAVMMSYVQCSVLGMSAIIRHGNSLLLKLWKTFSTPTYKLNRWRFRNRFDGTHEGSLIVPAVVPELVATEQSEQLMLNFG